MSNFIVYFGTIVFRRLDLLISSIDTTGKTIVFINIIFLNFILLMKGV